MKHTSRSGVVVAVVVAVALFVQSVVAGAGFSFTRSRRSIRIDVVRGGIVLPPKTESSRNPRRTTALAATDPSLPSSPRTSSMDQRTPSNRKLESPSAERNKGPIWEVLQSKVFLGGPTTRAPHHARQWNILEIAAGAGFLVPVTGAMMRMPGLPPHPAAENIDVDENGNIQGLF